MDRIDDTDKRILAILQEDSKKSVKELEVLLNLTKTPIYDRVKRLENSGLIEKYVAVIDTNKLEHIMIVFCSVSLENQKLVQINAFKEAIQNIPEVLECYLMGGANDFLLKVAVKDLQSYHQFSSGKLAALPNVSQIKSTFVLNEVKRSTVFPIL